MAEAVRDAVARHRPAAVAVERVAWSRNQVSALHVARATGAVMVVAAEAGLAVEEYGPNEVKQAVTGMGNADKRQVQLALARVHGLRDVPVQPDAADAAAVALTHLLAARMRGLAARRGRSMISFLEGEVVEKAGTRRLGVAGVGYDVLVPDERARWPAAVGARARVHTRMVVREDAMTLYGFATVDERALFDLLTGVTGSARRSR